MIFHSPRNYQTTSDPAVVSSDWLDKCVILIPILILAFGIYALVQSFNPDSWFCSYQIYKQPDGTYQVWWSCRTRHLEGTFQTYEAAKAFQVKENQDLINFMSQKPTGERTK